MIQTATKLLTFEEFLEWKPESGRYELHEGVIIEMQSKVNTTRDYKFSSNISKSRT